ncbi:PilE-like protein [Elusimicrobium minutum Pei191]|uniref:PilE-like protein n=1 Tax=Elusimicrobium minutum (strain Pei191) TaxID=445932 RepID=B2KCT9_ELUMP|nr:prepilin-type N-terminal cleavage/methylation domain-containing protein [Elusimicrobium minutum]ACC98335.1 PilE-like protein [Elusimicrobium minutum Pei191]
MKKGFTLIELLVVVLIIGILAAIALPQYTKTVEKARAAEVLASIRTLKDALEIYYMETGVYPTDPEALNVTIPISSNYDIALDNTLTNIRAVNKKGYSGYIHIRYFPKNVVSPFAGKLLCVANDASASSTALCKSLGGKSLGHYIHMSSGYIAYELN